MLLTAGCPLLLLDIVNADGDDEDDDDDEEYDDEAACVSTTCLFVGVCVNIYFE